MLELRNVTFAYKTKAPVIHDLSLTIHSGDFIGIVGRNGSGKTTLTRLMMSLVKPTAGDILLEGSILQNPTPAKMAHHIGYVFQNPDRQIFHDTVAEETAYGPKQLGYSPEEIKSFVKEALAVTGLSELSSAYPLSLTKGQKQRLAIASSLAMQPNMLILDEPTSGQDARERDELLKLLLTLNAQGKTILLVTHDMELLSACAQRAIVMNKGHKAFDGSVSQLFEDTLQLENWGLIQPAALTISRQLAGLGLEQTTSIAELSQNLATLLGRNDYAHNSPHN